MYKLLLCWRYLRMRYIALICIVSVMLGVATMIVVNSVMAGFSQKLTAEMNAMMGDLDVQVHSMDGVADAPAHMNAIRHAAGEYIEGMSPTATVPALIYMQIRGGLSTRPIVLVGIDEATYGTVSGVGRYLQHPANRQQLSFDLKESGYDQVDRLADDPAKTKRWAGMEFSGWEYRRARAEQQQLREEMYKRAQAEAAASAAGQPGQATIADPFKTMSSDDGARGSDEQDFNSAREQHTGIVLALSEVAARVDDKTMNMENRPGDDMRVSFPKASLPPEAISEFYTLVDVYQDPMRMDNASFAFVPLAHLQKSRGMIDPTTGMGKFTAIQIKLKPGADVLAVRDKLRTVFREPLYTVSTWQDKQGLLLAAIRQETFLLNVLLFFIVAVAGFGILSIFSMIVIEKTRDIGILKSLGASGMGVMGIFLSYGLTLGLVGAGAGVALGVAFSMNINRIKDIVEDVTDRPIFDQSIYFFDKLPTIIDPWTIAWISGGAVAIAILASILPARRAACLHPVRALRFE